MVTKKTPKRPTKAPTQLDRIEAATALAEVRDEGAVRALADCWASVSKLADELAGNTVTVEQGVQEMGEQMTKLREQTHAALGQMEQTLRELCAQVRGLTERILLSSAPTLVEDTQCNTVRTLYGPLFKKDGPRVVRCERKLGHSGQHRSGNGDFWP